MWRSQDFELRGPENRGAEFETTKASRGGEWGEGIPLPSLLGDLGSVVSSASGVRLNCRGWVGRVEPPSYVLDPPNGVPDFILGCQYIQHTYDTS